MDPVTIPPTRNGPPDSGHGGFSAGLFAATLSDSGPTRVRLHRPPPLGVPLRVERLDATVKIGDESTLVADVTRATELRVVVPETPTPTEAAAAAATSAFRTRTVTHPFPTCFGCGTLRPPGDGLQIWPGLTSSSSVAAAVWDARPWLNPDGTLPSALQWAALDCPGALGAMEQLGLTIGEEIWLLGTLTAEVSPGWSPTEPVVVLGWLQSRQGRKNLVGSALVTAQGAVMARAEAVWIQIDPEPA